MRNVRVSSGVQGSAAPRGARSTLHTFEVVQDGSMLVGVDFGGTQVKAGVVDGGEVVRSMTADTRPGAAVAEVLTTLTNVVLALTPKPQAVGFAIPGEVDAEGRCWRLTNVPGFEGVHIGRELAERLGCPIAVENDATA